MVSSTFRFRIILVILMVGFIFSNCISPFKKKVKEPEIFELKIESLPPDQFPEYIVQLKKISQESSDPVIIQKLSLLIAEVSIFHKNPAPNYDLALKEYEKYLKLRPDMNQNDKILNWLTLLRDWKKAKGKINEISDQLTTQIKNNQKLKENLSKQKGIIKKLKSDIKKLDSLYFNIEKKKKKKNNHQ